MDLIQGLSSVTIELSPFSFLHALYKVCFSRNTSLIIFNSRQNTSKSTAHFPFYCVPIFQIMIFITVLFKQID